MCIGHLRRGTLHVVEVGQCLQSSEFREHIRDSDRVVGGRESEDPLRGHRTRGRLISQISEYGHNVTPSGRSCVGQPRAQDHRFQNRHGIDLLRARLGRHGAGALAFQQRRS